MITKVISGGQTGIDRLGLEIAKQLGLINKSNQLKLNL